MKHTNGLLIEFLALIVSAAAPALVILGLAGMLLSACTSAPPATPTIAPMAAEAQAAP